MRCVRLIFQSPFKVIDSAVIGCAAGHWDAKWTKLPELFTIYRWRDEPRFWWGAKGPSIRLGGLLLHPHWTRETKITDWEGDRWFNMSMVMMYLTRTFSNFKIEVRLHLPPAQYKKTWLQTSTVTTFWIPIIMAIPDLLYKTVNFL